MFEQIFPIFAALASGLAFAGMQMVMKKFTTQDTHPLFTPAFFGLLAPVWGIALVILGTAGVVPFNLTAQGMMFPMLWAMVTVLSTCMLVWLFRTFSLTELTGYRKALITLGAVVADVVVFHLIFPLPELLAIGLLLIGALLLSRSRSRFPTPAEFGILVVWCSIMTVQITFYKEGQQYQSMVIANTILMQLVSSTLYACMWFLPKLRAQFKSLPLPALGLLLGFNLIGTVLEGFAYAGLPLAVLMVLTILPSTLFAAHDLWHGHLPRQMKSYVALVILATGLIMLMLTK